MRNSILISSDLQSLILVDTKQEDHRLAIGKRGVLLSVLGTDVCASEVPAELDTHIANLLKTATAFYSFEVKDPARQQLCITYNDANNAVCIIGITDVVAALSAPVEIPRDKLTGFWVRMKDALGAGLASKMAILARLETTGTGAAMKRFIRFYHLSAV